jgi:hypothetical protein
MDFITAGEGGDHLLPQTEEGDHTPHDFCPCHPVCRYINGGYFWVHNVSDEVSLWEQAEEIRQIVSVDLWNLHHSDSLITGKKLKVIHFPSGFKTPGMPPAAEK